MKNYLTTLLASSALISGAAFSAASHDQVASFKIAGIKPGLNGTTCKQVTALYKRKKWKLPKKYWHKATFNWVHPGWKKQPSWAGLIRGNKNYKPKKCLTDIQMSQHEFLEIAYVAMADGKHRVWRVKYKNYNKNLTDASLRDRMIGKYGVPSTSRSGTYYWGPYKHKHGAIVFSYDVSLRWAVLAHNKFGVEQDNAVKAARKAWLKRNDSGTKTNF